MYENIYRLTTQHVTRGAATLVAEQAGKQVHLALYNTLQSRLKLGPNTWAHATRRGSSKFYSSVQSHSESLAGLWEGRHCLRHFKTSLVLPGGKELSQLRTARTFFGIEITSFSRPCSLFGGYGPGLSTPGNQNSSEIKSRWIQSLPGGAPLSPIPRKSPVGSFAAWLQNTAPTARVHKKATGVAWGPALLQQRKDCGVL